MGLLRTALISGPAKVVFGTTSFWTSDDIQLTISDGFNDIESAMFGVVDKALVNPQITITFTQVAWAKEGTPDEIPTMAEVCAVLVPEAYRTWTYAGSHLIGSSSEVSCKIWGGNGDLWEVHNCVVTQPPEITLAADQPMFGPVTLTGLVKETSGDIDVGQIGSLYTYTASAAQPGSEYCGVPTYLQRRYKGAWASKAGHTEVWPQAGFQISFNPTLGEVRTVQGLTLDYSITNMEVMVSCVPIGPTAAQLLTIVGVGGSAGDEYLAGQLISEKQLDTDFVITETSASTAVFTLNGPVMRGHGFQFGREVLRQGEVAYVSQARFAAGVKANLWTWS
jgi:hypothetical protein